MIHRDTTQERNRPQTADRPDVAASASDGPKRPASRRWPGLAGESRGVSEVLGAILMFGLLISLLVLVQVNAVPAQNQQVEFEHNQRVEQDMLGLDRAILQSGMLDVPGSSEIELAAHYPSRFFLINPGVGAGTIETIGVGTITIEGANIPSTDNYWNPGTDMEFDTTSVRYRSNYKEYANAPETIYEHNSLVNVFGARSIPADEEARVLPVDSASFIDGDQLTLLTVSGDVSHAATNDYQIETTPVSAPAQTVRLESDTDSPIVLTLPTTLNREHWVRVLEDEPKATVHPDPSEFDTGEPYNRVTILLNPGSYELRMANVGLGSSVQDTSLDPRYLAADGSTTTETVRVGETKDLSVLLRDRFNNPVEGNVEFTIVSGPGLLVPESGSPTRDPVPMSANEEGSASIGFRATGVGANPTVVQATITSDLDPDTDTSAGEHTVTFTIDVSDSLDGGETDDPISRINPTDSVSLRYDRQGNAPQQGRKAVMEFRNDAGGSVEIKAIRALFFISNTGSSNNPFAVTDTDDNQLPLGSDDLNDDKVNIGGSWHTVPSGITVPNADGDNTELVFFFDENPNQGTLGVAVRYEKDGKTFVENYFIFFD